MGGRAGVTSWEDQDFGAREGPGGGTRRGKPREDQGGSYAGPIATRGAELEGWITGRSKRGEPGEGSELGAKWEPGGKPGWGARGGTGGEAGA